MPTSRKVTTSSRTCLCSPTSHPGSFRCSLHRKQFIGTSMSHSTHKSDVSFKNTTSTTTDMSKVNLFKDFLTHFIKPTNHHQQRKKNFQPRPTRFCILDGNQSQLAVS
ncbi:hypothetical protein RND71_029510 [Anisodus tanguticus]|uniref:Uncharacterized protein n=1 Tax=Anisodus tanguticus TaxID=243964 RepID=A0AAE1V096_9SOLA|nr:hypothetical protein RND71_029510 [Anisodus tanguticus]